MLVKTYGSAIQGIEATTVTVEVNIETGINFILVGYDDDVDDDDVDDNVVTQKN